MTKAGTKENHLATHIPVEIVDALQLRKADRLVWTIAVEGYPEVRVEKLRK